MYPEDDHTRQPDHASEPIEGPWVRDFGTLGIDDVALVGGKNASLGEMIGALSEVGIRVAWGLGESVVKGTVNPDQYLAFRPLLDEDGARAVLERVHGSKEE